MEGAIVGVRKDMPLRKQFFYLKNTYESRGDYILKDNFGWEKGHHLEQRIFLPKGRM